jgi:uncharacterized membrane protein YdjX (TVP38/TMEM64 family)
MRFWSFFLSTTAGMAPACFVYAYLGNRDPGNVNLFLVAFGILIAAVIVAAVVQRRRQGKPV